MYQVFTLQALAMGHTRSVIDVEELKNMEIRDGVHLLLLTVR